MNAYTPIGNTTTTSQAPSVNFDQREDHHDNRRRYTPPTRLITSSRRQRGCLVRVVEPGHAEPGHGEGGEHADCVERDEIVGVGADHGEQDGSASTASTMMPLENTSRWPRLVSQRGRNESSATKLARNGKPLKLVLPPV